VSTAQIFDDAPLAKAPVLGPFACALEIGYYLSRAFKPMYQQKPKNNISNPRMFAPANWKPLVRWLAPGQRENFAWMWRQGEYEYYRYAATGKYLVLDQFGQSYYESDLGFMPWDPPAQ
jgi:hypothetical protein